MDGQKRDDAASGAADDLMRRRLCQLDRNVSQAYIDRTICSPSDTPKGLGRGYFSCGAKDTSVVFMSRRLPATNPYLRDPAMRERMVFKSVATSSAIEGIRAPFGRATDATVRPTRRQTASCFGLDCDMSVNMKRRR